MLMVPRSFVHKERAADFSEKAWRSPSTSPTRRSTSESHKTSPSRKRSREPRSDPVRIPSKTIQDTSDRVPARPSLPPTSAPKANQKVKRSESAQDVLSSTSIPTRRKLRGRPSQRLPNCDYVADFSRLMMDDVKHYNRSMSANRTAPNFDGLFGSMDEPLEDGQMYVGSEGFDCGVMTTRSLSNESLTSIGSPGETADDASHFSSLFPSVTPDKKQRLIAASQDCSDDHPLSRIGEQKVYFASAPNLPTPQPMRQVSFVQPAKKAKSFKSSLTASLKAIKSAAKSAVSGGEQSENQSETLLARSFFDIQPSLTDDRRPPPLQEVPSAEIRHYFNPVPLEASQLHFWQEHRLAPTAPDEGIKSKRKRAKTPTKRLLPSAGGSTLINSLPKEVPLASCLPPNVRTANASSPPIWLAPDGTPTKRNTAASLLYDPDSPDGPFTLAENTAGLRVREPRENRDFLRVFVCEMQMRRSGKLKEDLNLGRARLWLPPVSDAPEGSGERRAGKKRTGIERWQVVTREDL